MIPFNELDSKAAHYKVPIATIEKDYIISWILICLSQSSLSKDFIFYGGTAIKKIYFGDHRYSEDIDLKSAKFFSKDTIMSELKCLNFSKEVANVSLQINDSSINAEKNRLQLNVNYTGYDEVKVTSKQVRIDFAMKREDFGERVERNILPSYTDIASEKSSYLQVMTLNTILANKLGLLSDLIRNEPRDIYDIWFLLNKTNEFDFNPDKIRSFHKYLYNIYPTWSGLSEKLDNPSLRRNWSDRLSHQIADLPLLEEVTSNIKNKIKKFKIVS